ncbi:MAG: ATP-dependent helicase [Coriobacteriales bacterium]|jgi:DNA helicase-2/ATP-dependent DNA helicase PcrA|nr:ATP-dependent helicase [Coriobacteriales bacterium]
MSSPGGFTQEFPRPNPEQLQAIETIDGPVLVVAGPGTGKTQLLSLRVANILNERDVSPENILCLTYTNAGAEAMTRRLTQIIGAAAYEVHISTFHSFATHIRNRYPEYFTRGALSRPITDLHNKRLLNQLLQRLPVGDPLQQRSQGGIAGNLREVQAFIGNFRKSGLKQEEFRAIIQQNLDFFTYIEEKTDLLTLFDTPLTSGKQQKIVFLNTLREKVLNEIANMPEELRHPVVSVPGLYLPYIRYFTEPFIAQELYDEETGRTEGYQAVRKKFFEKDKLKRLVFKDRKPCAKSLSALGVFEDYRGFLEQASLYDFDDMILDAIAAIEGFPELKYTLQERYQYVMVDEFQDTNGAQMRIIDLLTDNSPHPNILAVGDDDQAIMRFQGASVAFLNQFEEHYDAVTRIVLKTNYRSVPTLVDLGQAVAQQITNRAPASATEKNLAAHKTEPEPLQIHAKTYATAAIQYHEVAQAIKTRIDSGFIRTAQKPAEAIAVIASNHKSLRSLLPYLNAAGVAYNYCNETSVAQIASLQTLLALMRFVAAYASGKPAYADVYLPPILASDELGFAPRTYFSFALDARQRRSSWFEALGHHEDKRLRDLHAWLLELAKRAVTGPVRQIINDLAEPSRRYHQARAQEQGAVFSRIEFNYGLRALLDFVEDELANANASRDADGPLHLVELIAHLDEAARFDVSIEVELPIAKQDAITLTTAHSSKGLEYDLVYLLDVDQATWRGRQGSAGLLSGNLLFGSEKDEDDVRRLLFVAITRARNELELSLGKNAIVAELLDELDSREVHPAPESILIQSEHCWKDDYYPDDPDLLDLLRPHLDTLKMSASLLNSFVEYRAPDADVGAAAQAGNVFILQRLLSLPEAPSDSLEFGSLVHAFMEDYLNKVLKTQAATVEQLLDEYTEHISWLDFEASTNEHLRQRLALIAERFLPVSGAYMTEGAQAERWVAAQLDEVPLTGKCDLLVFDDEEKAIKVYDYKTGAPPDKDTPAEDYLRQLRFYKLLIESSPEYAGWKVQGGADIFVEPSKNHGGGIVPPRFVTVSESELEHLRLLIRAVWYRIQSKLFDTSAFQTSTHLQAVRAACVYKSSSGPHKVGDPKAPSRAELQPAYEQWLIDDYLQAINGSKPASLSS